MSSLDVIRDLEHAALRMTAAPPRVQVFAAADGSYVAALVVAVAPAAQTESQAVQQLVDLTVVMLDSNIDHDRVFRERLQHPAPTE